MKQSVLKWFIGIAAILVLTGCATTSTTGVSGGGGKSSGMSKDVKKRIDDLIVAIELQNLEINELRDALAKQETKFDGRVDGIQQSLDTHLELLNLYYEKLGAITADAEVESLLTRKPASITGIASIPQRSGDALVLEGIEVRLLGGNVADLWNSLSKPRSINNTPLRNAETLLTSLEFAVDLERQTSLNSLGAPSKDVGKAHVLNSHLLAFEKTVEAAQIRGATTTGSNGKYYFNNVPPGDYHIYAHTSPSGYTVCWLISLRVERGSFTEAHLTSSNAFVFLNDL